MFIILVARSRHSKSCPSTAQDDWGQHHIIPFCGKQFAQFCSVTVPHPSLADEQESMLVAECRMWGRGRRGGGGGGFMYHLFEAKKVVSLTERVLVPGGREIFAGCLNTTIHF
jgi:hypothetical protein